MAPDPLLAAPLPACSLLNRHLSPTSPPPYRSSSPQPLPLPHYALLLNISAHADLFAASLAVLRHVRSFNLVPDAACFHHALRAAGSADDVSAVLEIMSGPGASPTVPVIVTAVHKLASVAAGNFEGARRLIDKMPVFGCVPNAVAYAAMLDGMCSSENVDGAVRLIEEMEGSGLGANCAPNVVTYTCLVKCLCRKGREFALSGTVADAYDVVKRVFGDGGVLSGQVLNVLLICFWRVGMTAEAERLAQRMMKKGVQLTQLAGSLMVMGLCVRKRSLDACHWLGMMEENNVLCESNVYGILLFGLCEEGHAHEA
ncbi:hypothetical protein BAE44_0002780 [Dichanthelium oligosanthes]|uniref:Pentatricopeptide repeat-containing protein n=1 Tax=Dichanthelium oligosanthes TaxID=888268 RepID=A0A1E5WGC9_9POAL|nr:hypothetical protein BAE44_0002780 [Dichanthelium oligosanthes]